MGGHTDGEELSRRLLAADASRGRIAWLDSQQKTVWEYQIRDLHDMQMLEAHRVLFQTSWTKLIEVDMSTGNKVWEYDATKSMDGLTTPVEIHAFQRLKNGKTMIAESGRARIIEVRADGTIAQQIPLQVKHPHVHRDTRLVRKLGTGNYLVAHEGDGAVREYSESGKLVWEYDIPLFGQAPRDGHGVDAYGNQCFSALRLDDGNTLIATGNGHRVLEVSPDKKIVWQLEQNELPGIQLAWVTTLQVLPQGNIVFGNCHAGPKNPQIIEVTRDKKVVWTFLDFERFGDALSNSWVSDVRP